MMNKVEILIADDDPTQLDHLQNLILGTHRDAHNFINITVSDNKKNALNLIKTNCYDFLFCDLSFNDEDDPAQIDDDGLEIMTKAFERSSHTQIFLWSNKRNSHIAHESENYLNDIPVSFKSLPKDITLSSERFRSRYFLESLKIWTKLILTQAFQAGKEEFISAFTTQDFSCKFIVNGKPRNLSFFTIYWSFLGDKPTLIDLLELAPEQVYDLPKIEPERLFGKPYNKYTSNLASYYITFFDENEVKFEETIFPTAKELLNDIVNFYSSREDQAPLSIENTRDYPDGLLTVCNKISEAKLAFTAILKSPSDRYGIDQFIKRLWCRLVILGAYLYLRLPVTDCHYIVAYKKPEKKKKKSKNNNQFEIDHKDITFPDKETLNYYKRFLWIYSLTENSNSSYRKLDVIFSSLCNYEQEFLENWWTELKTTSVEKPEIQGLIESRFLDQNYRLIHQ